MHARHRTATMSNLESAAQRIMAQANALWVEMGLNDEQRGARMDHFSEKIKAALEDLLQKVSGAAKHDHTVKREKKKTRRAQHNTTHDNKQEIVERDAIKERLKQKQQAISDICECLGLSPPLLVC